MEEIKTEFGVFFKDDKPNITNEEGDVYFLKPSENVKNPEFYTIVVIKNKKTTKQNREDELTKFLDSTKRIMR